MKRTILLTLTTTALMATNYCPEPTNGEDGIDGIDGINGINGVDGTNGINGIDGITTIKTELDVTYTFDQTQMERLETRYDSEVKRIMDTYTELAENGLSLSAGANAVSVIDFNADHKGHSVGIGFGTGNTWDDYRAYAGALGYQYAWTINEKDVSFVTKAWIAKGGAYGIGFGGVVGF